METKRVSKTDICSNSIAEMCWQPNHHAAPTPILIPFLNVSFPLNAPNIPRDNACITETRDDDMTVFFLTWNRFLAQLDFGVARFSLFIQAPWAS
jgi:hypothetical protein